MKIESGKRKKRVLLLLLFRQWEMGGVVVDGLWGFWNLGFFLCSPLGLFFFFCYFDFFFDFLIF